MFDCFVNCSMKKCASCGKATSNQKFCSRSCSAKHTNKTPKRKKTKCCKNCDSKIFSRSTYCSSCKQKIGTPKDMTLGEAIYTKHHKSSTFALVRSRARKIAKDNNMVSCSSCGYDKHVEIAHIKPISSFPMDTPIGIINDLSNLKALCPNCHWEFDNM